MHIKVFILQSSLKGCPAIIRIWLILGSWYLDSISLLQKAQKSNDQFLYFWEFFFVCCSFLDDSAKTIWVIVSALHQLIFQKTQLVKKSKKMLVIYGLSWVIIILNCKLTVISVFKIVGLQSWNSGSVIGNE